MKVHVHPGAREDIFEAAWFYDEQEAGLGDRVASFLESQIHEIARTPGIHRRYGHFHGALAQGAFSYYMIYYTLELDGLHVRAVLDHRRDPKHIRRRLRSA